MSKLGDNIGCWVYCDLDGRGDKWRLAVPRGDMIYFPVEDFEGLADEFADDPKMVLASPTGTP